MKLYTEEQVREVLSNMLLTTEQVESILKELKPQDIPDVRISANPNTPNVWKELYDRYKLNSLVDDLNVIDTRDEIEIKEETKRGDRDFMYKWIREKGGK